MPSYGAIQHSAVLWSITAQYRPMEQYNTVPSYGAIQHSAVLRSNTAQCCPTEQYSTVPSYGAIQHSAVLCINTAQCRPMEQLNLEAPGCQSLYNASLPRGTPQAVGVCTMPHCLEAHPRLSESVQCLTA